MDTSHPCEEKHQQKKRKRKIIICWMKVNKLGNKLICHLM